MNFELLAGYPRERRVEREKIVHFDRVQLELQDKGK